METQMKHPFTNEELMTIFEMARISFADCDLREMMADRMDLADAEMTDLSEHLIGFLEN
jgi:hypothetical protein